MTVTIYHNPACGTSRNTLAMIRHSGEEPEIIDYLQHPPSRVTLIQLIGEARLTVREAIRQKEPIYEKLGLDNSALTDDQLLDAMLAHPILIQRPFVTTPKGACLCRPSEKVFEILPNRQMGVFIKEDGEVVNNADADADADADGQRIAASS